MLHKQTLSIVQNYGEHFIDFLEQQITDIQKVPIKADTEFQTMWNVAAKEGSIKEIKKIINNINQIWKKLSV